MEKRFQEKLTLLMTAECSYKSPFIVRTRYSGGGHSTTICKSCAPNLMQICKRRQYLLTPHEFGPLHIVLYIRTTSNIQFPFLPFKVW